MKRIFTCVLAFVMLVCGCMLLSSCGEEAAPGAFCPVSSLISSLDPQIASSDTERLIVLNCFEGLVRVGADGKIINGTAESYNISADGLTYTFKLRKEVKWHVTEAALAALKDKLPENFEPLVTADDFVFAFRRAVAKETGAADAYLLYSITNARAINNGEAQPSSLGVRAIDEYTLEIKLDMPDGNLLYTLAEPIAMPCNEVFFNAAGGRYGILIKYLLSNGPFYLSILNEESWRMNANSDYIGANTAFLTYVWLYYEKSRADAVSGISTGDYTVAVLDEYEKSLLSESNEAELIALDNVTMSFVFNHKSPVFKNENMRRAFCLATDAKQIASLFSSENTTSFIPASCGECGSSVPPEADAQLALEVLRDGLEELELDSASVNIYVAEGYYRTLNSYLQTWQSTLGVNLFITITSVSRTELESAVKSGKCDAAFYPLNGTLMGTRDFLMNLMPDSLNSPLNLKTGAFELTMLRSFLMNESNCAKLENTAADILTDDCSIFPIMPQKTYIAYNSGLTGVYSPYGDEVVFFAQASFNTEKG